MGIHRHRRVGTTPAKILTAPPVFSMSKNTGEMNAFLKRLTREADLGHRVFVDLQGIKDLTLDAIAVLTARIHDKRFEYGGVFGNAPNDPALHRLLAACGFFKHMQNAPEFDLGALGGQGTMVKESGLLAIGEVAQSLRLSITDQPVHGLYQVLMDCMNNTTDHATSPRAKKAGAAVKWWACAYRERGASRAHFAFVDNGVGILTSLDRQRRNMPTPWPWPANDADVMQAAFDGTIESSTFLPERGRGLPGMQRAVSLGLVKEMVVISNGVIADLDRRTFRTVKHDFEGTVLKWEVEV